MKLDGGKLQSIIVITIVITIAGAVMTQSLFRDVEQSNQSQFAMGTLDLAVADENGSQAQSINIANIGARNTLSGSKAWKIRNAGSLPGKLSVDIENIVNQDNGCNEPESLVDSTCDNPGMGMGELGPALQIELAMSEAGTLQSLVTTQLDSQASSTFNKAWQALPERIELLPGQDKIFVLSWQINGGEDSNKLQSDSVTFDLAFVLNQIIN